MASWLGLVSELGQLTATRQYQRAVQLLREAVTQDRENLWLRHQLADVLTLSGQSREALLILDELAETYARDGFHAKAIAVVKRMQRLSPDEKGLDSKFAAVIAACAESRAAHEGTWITDEMRHAYLALHRLGHAHSVEVWLNISS